MFDVGNDLDRRAPSEAANLAKTAILPKMANLATLPKGFMKANELAERALWKTAKMANLAKLCQRA